MNDKIEEIRARHKNGKSKNSHHCIGQVIESLDYLHGLDRLHDKDAGWETQFTNVMWWAVTSVEGSAHPPGVSPKIWEAFIVGDFDSTLGVATDGARHHLKEADDDRATLLAEVDRLSLALQTIRDQGGDVVERWSSEIARMALEDRQ